MISINKLILFLLLLVALSSLSYAVPPFTSTSTQVLSTNVFIETPLFEVYELNSDIKLHFHVFNNTGMILTNKSTLCLFHLYNSSQSHINTSYLKMEEDLIDWEIVLDKSLFKNGEYYQYILSCNTSNYGGVVTKGFHIDNNAKVVKDYTGDLSMIISIGIILAIFMFLAFKLEDSHGMLKLILIFWSVILIGMLPSILILNDTSLIFLKLINGFQVCFWIYVGCYIIYWILKKLNLIVDGEK